MPQNPQALGKKLILGAGETLNSEASNTTFVAKYIVNSGSHGMVLGLLYLCLDMCAIQ